MVSSSEVASSVFGNIKEYMDNYTVEWETPFQIRFSIDKNNNFEINDITLFDTSLTRRQFEKYIEHQGGIAEVEQECRDYMETI